MIDETKLAERRQTAEAHRLIQKVEGGLISKEIARYRDNRDREQHSLKAQLYRTERLARENATQLKAAEAKLRVLRNPLFICLVSYTAGIIFGIAFGVLI